MKPQWLEHYQAVWKILRQHYRHPQRLMLLLGILILASTLVGVYLPYIMKQIVDLSQLDQRQLNFQHLWSWTNLYILAAAFALGWLFSNILIHLSNQFSGFFMVNIDTSLVYKGLENYFSLSYAEQKKIDTGVINTDLWRGATAFGHFTYTTLFILVPVLFEILAMVWMLTHSINLSFAILFLLFAIVVFVLTLWITFKSKDIFTPMYEAKNQINQFVVEKVQAHYDIQVNASSQYELNKFSQRAEAYRHTTLSSYTQITKMMIWQVLFVGLFLLSFMLITVYLFEQQQVSTGDFVLISSYVIGLTMPVLRVSQSLIHLKGDQVALKKFYAYFLLPKQQYKSAVILPTPQLYQFKHAEFQLGKVMIRDFNLCLEQGKCYVIIGETGIGKTSFMQYLLGIEQINAGQLLYKNIDISLMFAAEIFQEVAVVSQLPIVYSGTLRDNLIHNSRFEYSDAELETWLARFNLSQLLAKNKLGLDDDLEDIYKSFSGGEKQRMSIIRALLKQPQCLIMDEPTAALNEEMGKQLLDLIRTQVKTIILISHAPYAKQYADELIDFDALIKAQGVNLTL
ncbi:ATP-binding cassette subfamily B protein [Acinetobacter calcoaceticus]|uniref:ATP-binding cassette subfamily B protein n=1 Tax=Acinetobacter calcoaceticus TaxID=471 RepID=A0A4R1XYZ0_ACICA|nr:ATP-binding cassette subfamily B protein [Acinetobacter calcoaceticus]